MKKREQDRFVPVFCCHENIPNLSGGWAYFWNRQAGRDESQHTTKAGDYSIILMRKVQGNYTVTKLVAGDVYDSRDLEITYPRTYSLANFIDLNQDGVLEVVVGFEKWEGFGAAVYQIDGQNVTEALKAGC